MIRIARTISSNFQRIFSWIHGTPWKRNRTNLKLWKPEGYFLLKSKHTCSDLQKDWLQYIYVIIVIRESKANIIADVKTGINKKELARRLFRFRVTQKRWVVRIQLRGTKLSFHSKVREVINYTITQFQCIQVKLRLSRNKKPPFGVEYQRVIDLSS